MSKFLMAVEKKMGSDPFSSKLGLSKRRRAQHTLRLADPKLCVQSMDLVRIQELLISMTRAEFIATSDSPHFAGYQPLSLRSRR
jgi:hypothetical protein